MALEGLRRGDQGVVSEVMGRCTNHALRASKRRSRQVVMDPASLDFEIEPGMADVADGVIANEARDAVMEALAEPDPEERSLIELLFRRTERAYAEIAAITGRPVGSLGPTRPRILDRLGPATRYVASTSAQRPDGWAHTSFGDGGGDLGHDLLDGVLGGQGGVERVRARQLPVDEDDPPVGQPGPSPPGAGQPSGGPSSCARESSSRCSDDDCHLPPAFGSPNSSR